MRERGRRKEAWQKRDSNTQEFITDMQRLKLMSLHTQHRTSALDGRQRRTPKEDAKGDANALGAQNAIA